MILGTGVDITDVRRFKKWVEQPELIDRFFNPLERSSGKSISAQCQHYAARFAAKEAFSKALGTGVGAEVGLTDFSVLCGERGEPRAVFSARGRAALENAGAADALVSLTHTAEFAEAVVILIR